MTSARSSRSLDDLGSARGCKAHDALLETAGSGLLVFNALDENGLTATCDPKTLRPLV